MNLLDMNKGLFSEKKSSGNTGENQAIKELSAWYGDFPKLARIAFKDNPQVLESFGMVMSTQQKKGGKDGIKERITINRTATLKLLQGGSSLLKS